MGNAELRRCKSRNVNREETEEPGAGCDQLGNADCGRQSSGIDPRGGNETIGRGEGDIEQTECRQTQSTMGGDAYGTARGMDYAELSISCDNRTDELRLLGNGVVPATATLAFQTLLAELLSK